ncbi:unnamed protein product, partial [Coregonus sp. 'balchen']
GRSPGQEVILFSGQGAPKKRTAFVDITNAHKVHISLPGTKKKDSLKKTQKKTTTTKNEANLKNQEEDKHGGEDETPVEELVAVEAIPEEFDIERGHPGAGCLTAEYVKEIFNYLKAKEVKFILAYYMPIQPGLNPGMRAILENFELNHETLYLAVKVTDPDLSTA